MAEPTIVFNFGTGSDTAASGAPSSLAAKSGANASTAAATAVVTLSVDAPDLSDVPTDGSAVMWVLSSSGRQFSKISAVDNVLKTVTCADNFSNTESGRTWGIGGKRATIGQTNSVKVFASTDGKAGWTVSIEDDQSISVAVAVSVAGTQAQPFKIVGSSESPRLVITQSANTYTWQVTGTHIWFESLKFRNTNATKTSAWCVLANMTTYYFKNCIIGDTANKFKYGFVRNTGTPTIFMEDCYVTGCTDAGVYSDSGCYLRATGCHFDNNDTHGIWAGGSSWYFTLTSCIFSDNGGDGINYLSTGQLVDFDIQDCTFDGNTGDGIDVATTTSIAGIIAGNQFTNNGGYGVRVGTADRTGGLVIPDFNNYFGNTSGARLNFPTGANDQALDPQYTSAGTDDYSIGTNTKEKGYPKLNRNIGAGQSTTKSFKDIGASQRQESAGGSTYDKSLILQPTGTY